MNTIHRTKNTSSSNINNNTNGRMESHSGIRTSIELIANSYSINSSGCIKCINNHNVDDVCPGSRMGPPSLVLQMSNQEGPGEVLSGRSRERSCQGCPAREVHREVLPGRPREVQPGRTCQDHHYVCYESYYKYNSSCYFN